jgi:hypothetical protein
VWRYDDGLSNASSIEIDDFDIMSIDFNRISMAGMAIALSRDD